MKIRDCDPTALGRWASLALAMPVLLPAALILMMAVSPPAATAKPATPGFTTLYGFCQQEDCSDGEFPATGVTVTSAGTIFGTTCAGGANDFGTIFSLTQTGVETVHANFSAANGACPYSANLLAKGSDQFFGTTDSQGADGCGTVFALTRGTGHSWTYKVLYSFASADDGCEPEGGLVMDKKGNLYGTTHYGGNGDGTDGYGTVFELSPPRKGNGPWTETILYAFCSQDDCADGALPGSTLVMDKAGTLYGVAYEGGDEDGGTLFAISAYGGETVLHSFCQLEDCADGRAPWSYLAMDAAGNLYGTTIYGGTGYYEGPDSNVGGTIFEFSAKGQFRVLYSFCQNFNCTDGYYPYGGVIRDKTGNIYGTTYLGGYPAGVGCGTVYELLHNAGEAVLHVFCSSAEDGFTPLGALTMDSKGNLYGTTYQGGIGAGGTVFKLTP